MRNSCKLLFPSWVQYLPVILVPFFLFAPQLLLGRVLYWGTPILQFYPWRILALKMLQNWVLPLWNPYNGFGAPLLANYQLALFYPPGWLVYLLGLFGDEWLAWGHTVLVVLHLSWAGIGMMSLLKKINLGWLGQVTGGLAFSMSGFFIARAGFFSIIWTATWFPWVILTASALAMPFRNCNKNQPHLPLSLVTSTGFMLLAGHAQMSWYIIIYGLIWVTIGGLLTGRFKTVFKTVFYYCAAILAGALFASIQLIPTAEYLFQSQRATSVSFDTGMAYSFWPWRFLTLFIPDLFGNPGLGDYWGYASYWEDAIYIGLLPVLSAISTLSVFVIPKSKFHNSYLRPVIGFLWLVGLVGALLALGKNTPVFIFLYKYIPTFNMFNSPARFMVWLTFSLSVLSGIGLDGWKPPSGRIRYWLRLATAGCLAVSLGALVAIVILKDIHVTFIRGFFSTGISGIIAGVILLSRPDDIKQRQIQIWKAGVVLFIGADLIFAGWFVNPTIGKNHIFTGEPFRISQEMITDKRIYLSATDEYNLKFRRFLRFSDYTPLEDPTNINRILIPNTNINFGVYSANNFDPMVSARYANWVSFLDKMDNPARNYWLAEGDVGYIGTIDINAYPGVEYVPLESPVGKARWVACPYFVTSEVDVLQVTNALLSSGKGYRAVIEDIKPIAPTCDSGEYKQVQIASESPVKFVLSVSSPDDGWVVLASSYYPGWKAKVDGNRTKINRADYLFMAVPVKSGSHRIEFYYQPLCLIIGVSITCLVILFLVFFFGVFRVRCAIHMEDEIH